MTVKIQKIQRRSLAASLPIGVGDEIIKVDNEQINDILDLMFYTQKENFIIEYKPKSKQPNEHQEVYPINLCHVTNHFDKPLGIEVSLAPCRSCVNNCIFCFVGQMPIGFRDSLYIKDDDFTYSFFYGNFITLTNLSQRDIKKIQSQHIAPLYVSVHTTNPELHKKMLCYSHNFNILETLQKLSATDIEIHAQIVVVPNYNDKAELFKTLTDLVEMENISTIGVVPVGLTKFCNNKVGLRKITKEEALELITHIEYMKNMRGISHIQCADELFILAELPIPNDSYYGNYDQIENGIGLVRKAWENWKYFKRKFILFLKNKKGNPVFVTSISGINAINPILKDIQKALPEKRIIVNVIKNRLFGDDVTVTGLLPWRDIKSQLVLNENEYLILPSVIFNIDGLTIDDFDIEMIKKDVENDIIIVDEMLINIKK